jgi:hypothetical protein
MKPLGTSAYTESRRAKTARRYRTHCKICRKAIFTDEVTVWLMSPMGLSHKGCAA